MREIGYYWVKMRAAYPTNWEVAYYTLSGWNLTGLAHMYHDRDFEQIDENRITRDIIISGSTELLGNMLRTDPKA